jgi:hypothetical protein
LVPENGLGAINFSIVGNPAVGGGVSIKTIRIRLGHESLDVTLAYLNGKDAESEEAQEHANSSSLALYA